MKKEEKTIIEMFGLTADQALLMFSIQRMVTAYDIYLSKEKKNFKDKALWLSNWEESVLLYLREYTGNSELSLIKKDELEEKLDHEYKKSPNKTWYYIAALECLEFTPYTSLGNSEEDKIFRKLKYNEKACDRFLSDFYIKQGVLNKEIIERFYKTYDKSMSKISGKGKTIAVKILITLGISALCAALAAIAAPQIAILIFGKQFAGLSGAALASACLAMAGGGAIAAQGLGMAGGVALIAGGGALLGLAGGGTAVATTSILLLKAPDFTLTLAAKLETILKEIILNSQKDIVNAQIILKRYKEQISDLTKEVELLKLDSEVTKEELKNIKESLKYMEKSYNSMKVFESAFEEGLKADEKK